MTQDVHTWYMHQALKQAQKAYQRNEVPIGAVVVDEKGAILARGYNLVEARHQQTAHAEMLALDRACKKRKDWRLTDCTVYVTLEPCAMCMNLLLLCRVKGVVFGAPSPLFGYRLDKHNHLQVYKKDTFHIVEGICAAESANLLRKFFKEKRTEHRD